jgi:hypothetical protein
VKKAGLIWKIISIYSSNQISKMIQKLKRFTKKILAKIQVKFDLIMVYLFGNEKILDTNDIIENKPRREARLFKKKKL